MNRTGQFYAVREIFQFGLGIVLLTSLIYMFYNSLIPSVADYAMELEAGNVNSHVRYLFANLVELVNEGVINGVITLEYAMPSKIADYEYTTYFSGDNLCTFINALTLVKCVDLNSEGINLEGAYLSGGDLKLKVTKTESETSVLMSN